MLKDDDRPKVTCVGHVTEDLYPSGAVAGGAAYFATRVFLALGCETTLMTQCRGGYPWGDELAAARKVVGETAVTTQFRNTYPAGEDRVMRVGAVAPPVGVSMVAKLSPPELLFLCPVVGEVGGDWFSVPAGLRVAGLQGFFKVPGELTGETYLGVALRRLAVNVNDELFEQFSKLDAAVLSEEDLTFIDHPGLLDRLRGAIPVVVVTDGRRGATVYEKAQAWRVGALTVAEIDPTGAGDTFGAVFAHGLSAGLNPVKAAKLASAGAASVVASKGGANRPDLQKMMTRAKRISVTPL